VCKCECHSFQAKNYHVYVKYNNVLWKKSTPSSPFLFNRIDNLNWLLVLKHVILYLHINRISLKNHVSCCTVLFFLFQTIYHQQTYLQSYQKNRAEWHRAIVREVMNHVNLFGGCFGVHVLVYQTFLPLYSFGESREFGWAIPSHCMRRKMENLGIVAPIGRMLENESDMFNLCTLEKC